MFDDCIQCLNKLCIFLDNVCCMCTKERLYFQNFVPIITGDFIKGGFWPRVKSYQVKSYTTHD